MMKDFAPKIGAFVSMISQLQPPPKTNLMTRARTQNFITVNETARVLLALYGGDAAVWRAARYSNRSTARAEPDNLVFWSAVLDEIRFLKSVTGISNARYK